MHFLVLFLFLNLAHAHQNSLTGTGHPIRWPIKTIPVSILTNTADLSPTTTESIIQTSIAQWNMAGSAKVAPQSTSNNQIKFSSEFGMYGSAVIGMTELNYNSSGVITKASILLNDNYQFMSTPGFYFSNQVFLGDVVTHELGHFLGLSHSEVLNSTMFFSAFPGQNTLSYDDKAGVRSKYDTGFGKIHGYVQGGNHIGVLGVHVQAISRKTGESVGVISDEDGRFEINGLDLNDTFYLYTAPLKKLSSLPGNFSNTKTDFCPGSYVGSFFNQCGRDHDGFPQGINLTASEPIKNVGAVTIHCALKSSEDYSYQKIQTSFAPVSVYDYGLDLRAEKSFVGYFTKPTTSSVLNPDILKVDLTDYIPTGSQKYLKVSLHGQIFGNQVQYAMTGERNGVNVPEASQGLNCFPYNEPCKIDFSTFIPLSFSSSQNNFEFKISASSLSADQLFRSIPSYELFSSATYLPYLFVSSIWEISSSGAMVPIMDSGRVLSDNSTCLEAPLTYASSKVISTLMDSSEQTDSKGVQATGCATIDPPDSSGPGSGLLLMTLGFLLTVLVKSSKKFLS